MHWADTQSWKQYCKPGNIRSHFISHFVYFAGRENKRHAKIGGFITSNQQVWLNSIPQCTAHACALPQMAAMLFHEQLITPLFHEQLITPLWIYFCMK
jgi:hypothetical protein